MLLWYFINNNKKKLLYRINIIIRYYKYSFNYDFDYNILVGILNT